MKNGTTVKVSVLEERMTNWMEENERQHKEVGKKIDCLDTKLDAFIKSADQKYANKVVEKIVWLAGTALVLWFLNNLFHLVEIH